jgi:D-amino-acid dehydrogenase
MDASVTVIGGGIVGSAVAYHCAREGRETVLVDRADAGRATDAGAGILSPPTSSRAADDDWFRLAAPAVGYYPDLVATLETDGVTETGYTRCGLLAVAPEPEDTEALAATERRIERRAEGLGYPAEGSVSRVDPDDAVARFPPLARPERALLYADGARVDGQRMERALRQGGRTHGLQVVTGTAERLRLADGRVTGVVTDEGTVDTDRAVIAGGAWSGAFADQLGVSIPVEPQRGQIVHLDAGDRWGSDTGEWPVVTAFDHRYLVPWAGGRVAVGATDDPGAGYRAEPTVSGVRWLLETAETLAPGLASAGVDAIRAGLRPVAADGRPVIGAVPGVEGAVLATGHGATGLQLGPYTGRLVADLLAGREPAVDLHPFRPGRFDGG